MRRAGLMLQAALLTKQEVMITMPDLEIQPVVASIATVLNKVL